MSDQNHKRIVGLLGVGFDAEDGHIRITNGKNYEILMGSEESHDYIHGLIRKIECELQDRNLELEDLSPDKFGELVKTLQ